MYQATSKEAYEAVKPELPSLRTLVLNELKAAGETGLTSEDLYKKYPDMAQSSFHARFSELQVRGLASHHGYRRNVRGRKVLVWVATQSA